MAEKKKTVSKTSPKKSKKGCVCEDGTYSSECCDGTLQAQGIGATTGGGTSVHSNTNTPRYKSNARG